MLTTWLASDELNGSPYRFSVTYAREAYRPDDQVIQYLAREIVLAHGVPGMIRAEYEMLIADAEDVNLTILKEYVEEEVLPSKGRTGVRIGNFGEMLAARFLVEFEEFWLPIYKLRYREKIDWAPRLTDLCVIKVDNLSKPLVCYGEVKTNSTRCKPQLAVDAHDQLAKDDALENPEILHFICVWLYEKGLHEEAEFLSAIRLQRIEYEKRHDVFLVHTCASWHQRVLDNLDAHELDGRLVDLSVKVILVEELREVIDKAYAGAWEGAKETVRG